MSHSFNESVVESAALSWFSELGYDCLSGPDIAPGELLSERASHGDAILPERLRTALSRINPSIPAECLEDAIRRISRTESPSTSSWKKCADCRIVTSRWSFCGNCSTTR